MAEQNVTPLDDQLFAAARKGDIGVLTSLLDEDPDKLQAREQPYEWSLLHAAAHTGQLAAVDLLLTRGLDANTREKGDNTYAMHWAAAAGHLDIVRRLADAGGDVVGHGDDHSLEVIGWATGWDGCDDETHRQLANFLVSRGAKHNIFSAIAMNLPDEVRRIVRDDPTILTKGQSHNEDYQLPLHFAARKNRIEMVALLMDLGADPMGRDASGVTPLHVAASQGQADIVRLLLSAGADPSIRDNIHDSDVIGWADYFEQPEIVEILRNHPTPIDPPELP